MAGRGAFAVAPDHPQGLCQIPKAMPLVLQIMDELSKGKRLSETYLGLWRSTWANSFVTISKAQGMAHAAGFSRQRADRMKRLHELNFINIKPGKSGPITHVLIWNPHIVIRGHYEQRTPVLTEATYNILLDRALEIGARDLVDAMPQPEPVSRNTGCRATRGRQFSVCSMALSPQAVTASAR